MMGCESKEVQNWLLWQTRWRKLYARNRIISGLSLGVLVSEATIQSGALITAGFALKQGRDVFGILSSKSSGVNKLIQEGAKPVMDVTDILKALYLFMVPQQLEMQAMLPDNGDERVLLKLISHEPCHIDELIRASGSPTTTVSSTLTMMELKGWWSTLGDAICFGKVENRRFFS